jgi:hypothetical protein
MIGNEDSNRIKTKENIFKKFDIAESYDFFFNFY